MYSFDLSTLLSTVAYYNVIVFLLSFAACLMIILVGRRGTRLAGREADLTSVQAAHSRQTPRIGGVGIFAALLGTLALAPVSMVTVYGQFLVAAAVLFLVGLAEDLGWHMSPLTRLAAAALASIATVVMLGMWIPRFDIPGLDALASHWAVGVPLTVFFIAGIANGFNLIDGVNGLAGMAALCAALALAVIGSQAGYLEMAVLASMLAAGILGFLVLNYPFGWIFLGDAGAYTLGFVLSWFGVFILVAVPAVTPWAILLTLFWPVADTLLALYRRSKRKQAAMQPDRLHAHQLVMRALEVHFLGRRRRHIANPLTTLCLFPFVAAPPLAGVMFWDNATAAFLAFSGFGIAFAGSYVLTASTFRARASVGGTRKAAE